MLSNRKTYLETAPCFGRVRPSSGHQHNILK